MRFRRFLAVGALAALLAASIGLPASSSAGLGNPRTGYQAGNVVINPSGAYTDGPTVQIGNAGNVTTWVVSGGVLLTHSADCKLWDGSQIVASGYLDNDGTLAGLSGFIVESSQATLKISCASFYDPPNGDPPQYIVGGTGSWVTAVKVN